MSQEGVSCRVKIDEINLIGWNDERSDTATIDLSGYMHECRDIGLTLASNRKGIIDSCNITIEFREEIDKELDSYNPWPENCIGIMFLRTNSINNYSIVIQMALRWHMLDKLISLKDNIIFIEPFFLRGEDGRTKIIEKSELDGDMSYLKAVQISPYLGE